MAGHSKWSNIKFRKNKQDNKRCKIFNKISNEIIYAASLSNCIKSNSKLKMIVQKALSANMPKKNIEKAIERGKLNSQIEENIIEAFSHNGVAILIYYEIYNRKKLDNEIKSIFDDNKCSLVKKGSSDHIFKKEYKVDISIKYKYKIDQIKLEIDIKNIKFIDKKINFIIKTEKVNSIKSFFKKNDIEILKIVLNFSSQNKVILGKNDKDLFIRLIKNIQKIEGVKNIFHNADIKNSI